MVMAVATVNEPRWATVARRAYLYAAVLYYVPWLLGLYQVWTLRMVPPGEPVLTFLRDGIPLLFLVTALALLVRCPRRQEQIALGAVAVVSTCALVHGATAIAQVVWYERNGYSGWVGWW